MAEIAERYVEQLQTTAETLRRRFVAYYDGIFYVGQRIVTAAERARDIAEPAAYDMFDYTSSAVSQSEPLGKMDKDLKNSTVELYLNISVLMIGLSAGELAGALALPPLLEAVFDGYIEFACLIAIPVYIYLSVKKNAAMDDVERRTTLFGCAVWSGALCAHLIGTKFLSMVPAVLFITPLIFALLFDNELFPTPFPDMDRQVFFYVVGAITTVLCALLAIPSVGHFSFGVAVLAILHGAFLFGHFQLMMQHTKDKIFGIGEAQYSYLFGILALQVVTYIFFGYDLYAKHSTAHAVPVAKSEL